VADFARAYLCVEGLQGLRDGREIVLLCRAEAELAEEVGVALRPV